MAMGQVKQWASGASGPWLGEFWYYRELFYFLVWRDVKVRYKQTIFGAAWAVIVPFVTMVVFTLFFRNLAKMPSDGIPYPIFSYSALLPWTYFSMAINSAGMSLVMNRPLLTKVYFPRMVIPTSAVLCGLVDFAIASIVLAGMMIYYRMSLSWEILLWPMLIILLVMLSVGVGMIFASLNVRYRDVRHALPFVTQIWLFVTPVIYPSSMIPEAYRPWLMLNPLTGLIEAFRASLLASQRVDWSSLGMSAGMTIVIFAASVLYFRKTERTFADII
jgi:lipopolysaccharide transport system permease protein